MPRVRLPEDSGPGSYRHRDGLSVQQGETADVDEEMAAYLVEDWGFEVVESEEGDLEDMTKEEVYEIAGEEDIDGRSEMTKDELIDALSED